MKTLAISRGIVVLSLIGGSTLPMPAQSQQVAVAERPSFEVVSIKPNKNQGVGRVNLTQSGGHLTATNVSVKFVIIQAYQFTHLHFGDDPVGADWIETEHFDIDAVVEGS